MAHKSYRLILPLLFLTSAAAASIPNTGTPSTFVGPFVHGSVSNKFNPWGAFSVGADLGVRNYRLDGTLAWQDEANQRFKLSAEWLTQNITYSFFAGNTMQWNNQTSIGFQYRYIFESRMFDPQAEIDAYYLHAITKALRTETGTYTPTGGVPTTFVNIRRIAGVDAGGVAPGVSLSFWPGSRVAVKLNYDNNNFDTFYVPNKDAKGLGGTVQLKQALSEDAQVGFQTAFLQAYNNYQASVEFGRINYFGVWALGLTGDYTIGKNSMPDTFNVGFTIDYLPDAPEITSVTERANRDNFLLWSAQSAAYKPQVVGLPDESIT